MAQDLPVWFALNQPMAAPTPAPWAPNVTPEQVEQFKKKRTMLIVPEIREPQAPQQVALPVALPAPPPPPPGVTKQAFSYHFTMPPSKDEIELTEAFKQLVEQRRAGISDLEKQIQDLRNKPVGFESVDLSPLAAAVDSWTGSNIRAGYEAPKTLEKNQAMILELEKALRGERDRLSDDQLRFIKDRASLKNSRALIEMGRQARFEERERRQMEDTIRKDVTKIMDNFAADVRDTEALARVLDQPNVPIEEVQMILSQFARRVGGEKGALSDGDVARAMPGTAINTIEKFKMWIGERGMLDPKVREAMRKLVAIARENAAKYYQERLAERRKYYDAGGSYSTYMQPGAFGDNIFRAAEDSAMRMIQQSPALRGATQVSQVQSAGAGTTGFMSPQEWLAKKRAGSMTQ